MGGVHREHWVILYNYHSFVNMFFIFFNGHACSIWKFLGQGWNQSCSCRHLDCVNFSTLVVILYCCFARCFHLEKLDKRCTDLSALFHLSECESLSHNKSLTYKYDLLIHTLIHFYLVCYESTNVWVNM